MHDKSQILLDGAQCGCHGPSEEIQSVRRELQRCGVTVAPRQHVVYAKRPRYGGAVPAPAKPVPAEGDAAATQQRWQEDGGRIGGEIQVLSLRRELQRLQDEDAEERERVSADRKAKVAARLLDAERAGKLKVIEAEEEAAAAAVRRAAEESLTVTWQRERIRKHSERLLARAEDHVIDEQEWFYSESQREIFECARAKVAAEFEKQQSRMVNEEVRREMQQQAIERIFRQDGLSFKRDSKKSVQDTSAH